MRHLGSTLIALHATWIVFVQGELYSSLAGMDRLLDTQKAIVQVLEQRIILAEENLEKMKKLKEEYNELLEKSSKNFQEFIANPINAFILIKKLVKDWDVAKAVLYGCHNQELEDVWKDVKFPDENDLAGASQALLRLQQTYNLKVSSLADGRLKEISSALGFSPGDCFEMGRQALFAGYYDYAILWFEMAYKKLQSDNRTTCEVTSEQVARHIKLAIFEKGRSAAWMWAQNFLKIGEIFVLSETTNSESVPDKSLKSKNLYNIHTDPTDLANYNKLCQVSKESPQMGHISPKLHCRHVVSSPYFVLRPVQEEEIWSHPKILLYHNVVSDKEIAVMKALAMPILNRAEVAEYSGQITHKVSETRVTKTAWLQKNDHPVIAKMYHRIEDITGLATVSAEAFQMANYGLGGHFHLHLDVLPDAEVYFGADTGNRIATWLIYLSDVEAGGATVFPRLNLTVWPRKGTALFWHNIKSDGMGDFLTLHGACPVVTGSKWVSNVWLHERGQEFRLRCGKEPNSPLLDTRGPLNFKMLY